MPTIEPIGHIQFLITEQQKKNLKKLADYLLLLPEDYDKFAMGTFFSVEDEDVEFYENQFKKRINECGTVACAVGHAPLAGIRITWPKELEKENRTWLRYSYYAFGADIDSKLFDWCFGSNWDRIDNTPQGAGKRILYFLEKGIPEDIRHLIADRIGFGADEKAKKQYEALMAGFVVDKPTVTA